MKTLGFVACVLAFDCLNCVVQAGPSAMPQPSFSAAAPALRSHEPLAQTLGKDLKPQSGSASDDVLSEPKRMDGTSRTDVVLNTGAADYDLRLFRQMDEAGYFTLPRRSENPVDRFVGNTFEPAVIHFRKVEVSCSLITAIKRKNPLCLLNPLFFNLSW